MNKTSGRKHLSTSIRMRGYDYSSDGIYFVTIDTYNRMPFFGSIKEGRMSLSECGIIAQSCWKEIPEHFPSVFLDDFVIMPDHLHGIIIHKGTSNISYEKPGRVTAHEGTSDVSFGKRAEFMSSISPKSGSLGTMIRSYKAAVSKMIHPFQPAFRWHSGYYDHIVRNYDELLRIQTYIQNNPVNWKNVADEYPWQK